MYSFLRNANNSNLHPVSSPLRAEMAATGRKQTPLSESSLAATQKEVDRTVPPLLKENPAPPREDVWVKTAFSSELLFVLSMCVCALVDTLVTGSDVLLMPSFPKENKEKISPQFVRY